MDASSEAVQAIRCSDQITEINPRSFMLKDTTTS